MRTTSCCSESDNGVESKNQRLSENTTVIPAWRRGGSSTVQFITNTNARATLALFDFLR